MKKLLLFLLFSGAAQAQLQINTPNSVTPTKVVTDYLVGAGITPFNVKFNGSTANATNYADQCGFFKMGNTATNLGFSSQDKGALLTTGKNIVALGPNNYPNESSLSTFPTPVQGDPDLAKLSNGNIKNVAILEFDFVATGLELNFDYVFGSEEYPEYVNSGFNDTFGFFLSGPGISGGKGYVNDAKNIALIPGTDTAVSINTLNSLTNSQYYVANPLGSPDTQYDGFSRVMRAASDLQCGMTYHIKLAIANVSDNSWDSGVFLKNFSCPPAQLVDNYGLTDNPSGYCAGDHPSFHSGITLPGATFVWMKDGELLNETGPNLIVTSEGTYCFEAYTSYGCKFGSDCTTVTFLPPLPINDPKDIVIENPKLPYTVNINQTAAMLGSEPESNYDFSYYETSQDAANGSMGRIPSANLANYVLNSPSKTIWIRVEDLAESGCIIIKPFTITITNMQPLDIIKLVAFVDENGNGIKDDNEVNFTNGSFVYQQNNTGPYTNITAPKGSYDFYDTNPDNTYDFTYQVNTEMAQNYTASATNYNDLNIPVGSGTQLLYFPITLNQDYNDVTAVLLSSNPPPRPGFTYYNTIKYTNLSMHTASGTVTFTKDPKVTITFVDQTGIVTSPTGFTYDFSNLGYNQSRYIGIAMTVPPIPTVHLGDVLTNSVSIAIPATDANPDNNSFSNTQTIVGSYDPNDMMEAHGEKIPFTDFHQDEYLFYTVHFQNTGTSEAINISVQDVLDAKLDETSVEMVAASHDYILERIDKQLTWDFNAINLPGAAQNQTLSNGYISFRVKLKPGFGLGDIIPNKANIYFDYNPAIETNTFNTEFTEALATSSFTENSITLYPNPATNFIQITTQNTDETLKHIVISDMQAKTVKSVSNLSDTQTSVDISNLAKGIYMVEITSESNLKLIRKLVVQ